MLNRPEMFATVHNLIRRCQSPLNRWCLALVALAWFLLPGPSVVHGQQNPLQAVGIPLFNPTVPVESGFINTANGDLHLEIPMGTYPERGGKQLKSVFMYDSNIWVDQGGYWEPVNVTDGFGGQIDGEGWRVVTSANAGRLTYSATYYYCTWNPTHTQYVTHINYTNWAWIGPDGSVRSFPKVTTIQGFSTVCGSSSSTAASDEAEPTGSGYHLFVTNYTAGGVFAPDGSRVLASTPQSNYPSTEDTNGNYSTISGYVLNPPLVEKDAVGRPLVTRTFSGNYIYYDVLNSQGTTSRYTVTTETIPVWSAFGTCCNGYIDYHGNILVVQSIQMPDGSSYSFQYDSGTTQGHYGTLTAMTVPTGATISYSYKTFVSSCYVGSYYVYGLSTLTTPDSSIPWKYALTSAASPNCETATITKPSGDNVVYTHTASVGSIVPTAIQYYNGSVSPSNLVASLKRTYGTGQPIPTADTITLSGPSSTSINKTTQFTWDNTGGVSLYHQLMKKQEWNFYTGSLPATADRTTTFAYLGGTNYLNANTYIVDRQTSSTVTNSSGATVSQALYSYDGSALVSATGVTQHDDTNYGTSNTFRGNLTQVQRLVSGSTYLTTSMTYDMTGQARALTDSNGNTTQYDYTDNFYTDPGDGQTPTPKSVSPPTNAYLKTITYPTVNSITLTKIFGYYWGTGQIASTTDENSNTTYSHFYDSLNRPTSTALPNSEWTRFTYTPTETQLDEYTGTTNSGASTNCTVCRHDQTILDALGRVVSKRLVNDPDGETYINKTYDLNGRIASASNPYRGSQNGVETPSYDGLDRITQVKHADNNVEYMYYGANVGTGGGAISQLCSSSTYGFGYPLLTLDEAGNKRQTWRDGFGRVIETDEPGSNGSLTIGTCYNYDLNNNLTQVTSLGLTQTQKPTYTYDLVSRVTSKSIPGAGAISYSYTNSAGSLCSGDPTDVCRRTDARNIITSDAYDALNRLTAKTYSDGTLPAYFYYDQSSPWGYPLSNYKGRLTTMGTLNGSLWVTASSFDYDSVGHVIWEQKLINQNVGVLIYYSYNFDGSIASITYPGGRIVNYTEGNAQRMTNVADSTNNINYVTAPSSGVMYAPQGAVANALHGYVSGGFAGITESYTYNNRLQVTGIEATSSAGTPLNLAYGYASGNNGNILTQTNNVASGRTQNYTYDPLNRLLTAQSAATSGGDCWGQSFGNNGPPTTLAADALANLFYTSAIQCSSPAPQYTMNTTNNDQFTGTGIAYDAAGDMTNDNAYSYIYDPENRIISASGMTNGPYCYIYDAIGLRAAKGHASGGSCTGTLALDMLYWRDIAGNTIAETDGTASTTNSSYNEYVLFAGRKIAQSNPSSGNLYYYFADHLGSTRVVTTATGTACYEVDYLPYGSENTPSGFSNTCSTHYRFTGYERDLETAYGTSTGNDYAFARYYNQRLQRFMSLDPKSADLTNPQSLNPYAYVLDNSLNRVDPTGLESFDDNNGGGDSGDPNDNGLSDSPTCGCNYEAQFMGIRSTSAVAFASADLLNSANAWSPDTFEFFGTMCGAKNCTTYVGSFDSWDQYSQWRAGVNSLPENQPSYPTLYQQQLDNVTAKLKDSKADPEKIQQFKEDNAYDKNDTFQLQGGNFDFKDADLFKGLCGPTGRCNNGLDFSHDDGTFHVDTANPLDILHGGPFIHLAVDLIYGNIVSIIPR